MNEWERWQQMKEVLHHALEREPSERADSFELAILYQVTDGDLDVGGDTLKPNLNAPAFRCELGRGG